MFVNTLQPVERIETQHTALLRRAAVEDEVIVSGLTHELLEETENAKRSGEDEDLVAAAMPDCKKLAENL